MRIVLCDDQVGHLKRMRSLTDEYFTIRQLPEGVEVKEFPSSQELLGEIGNGMPFDIAILDVCMPETSGLEIARKIRIANEKCQIIFISSSREYAVDAFTLNAVHYLVKPYSQDEFRVAMDRAIGQMERSEGHRIVIHLPSGAVTSVDVSQIQYIESIGYKRFVHALDGVFEETKTTLSKFFDILENLSPGLFIQPYRGYIVNLDAIRTVNPDKIIMSDGFEIIIKRGDFRKIRDVYFSWAFGKKGGDL